LQAFGKPSRTGRKKPACAGISRNTATASAIFSPAKSPATRTMWVSASNPGQNRSLERFLIHFAQKNL
jgi:hypothetical protein